MKRFYNLFKQTYLTQVPAEGLALFRIFYGLVMFLEISQLLYFENLIIDVIPFLDQAEFNLAPVLVAWLICLGLLIMGMFTQYVTIVNYILTLATISVFGRYEYHLDWTLIGVNFLLMFMPLSTTFSVDRLIEKLKYSTLRVPYKPKKTVSLINYYLPVMLGIGLVYIDSVFFKLASPMWLKGLGFWKPSSLPWMTYNDLSFILNNKILSITMGYVTLLFEMVFIFLVWSRRFRIPLVIIGVGLHIGILVAYPIPLFALGITSIYLLLIPPHYWRKLADKLKGTPTLTVYYDELCPLCNRTRIVATHFDIFKKISFKGVQTYAAADPHLSGRSTEDLLANIHSVDKKGKVFSGLATYQQIFKRTWWLWPVSFVLYLPGFSHLANYIYGQVAASRLREECTEDNCSVEFPTVQPATDEIKLLSNFKVADLKMYFIFAFVLYCLGSQFICILKTPVINNTFKAMGVEGFSERVSALHEPVNTVNKKILGIKNHAVFLDGHFKGYNHIVAVVFHDSKTNQRTWLPIITPSGQISYYNTGKQWARWTWRTNGTDIHPDIMSRGIRHYTAFWAHKNNISLKNATFEILVKKTQIPEEWEYDFLKKQMSHPWLKAGEVYWKNNQFDYQVTDIEKL